VEEGVARGSFWKEGLTGSSSDVVEGELSDTRVHLEEEREGLANTTSGAENGNLGELDDDISQHWVFIASFPATSYQERKLS
jgi:hypothetical protein